jgi:hypothetical protein
MHSQLGLQMIQANQQELAARRSMAEHHRALREERAPKPRRRRRRRGLAVAAVALESGSTQTVAQEGAWRFFKHR